MTTTQQVFVVFFAIFWGGVFNVLARWKMFNWPLLSYRQVKCRLALSTLMFNLLPLLTFALFFWLLSGTPPSLLAEKRWYVIMPWTIAGVLPAFAIFGFYRLWLGIVECCRETFYMHKSPHEPDEKGPDTTGPDRIDSKVEPSIESLALDSKWSRNNLVVGVAYIAFALISALAAALAACYSSPANPNQ